MEKQTEKIRCQLAGQEDFNLFQVFKKFDDGEEGSIDFEQFLEGLVYFTGKEPNAVVKD